MYFMLLWVFDVNILSSKCGENAKISARMSNGDVSYFFNLLAVPPCNGVITWTEVDHLLQKY